MALNSWRRGTCFARAEWAPEGGDRSRKASLIDSLAGERSDEINSPKAFTAEGGIVISLAAPVLWRLGAMS